MRQQTPDDIYRLQTAHLYDAISTGLEGDVDFYVEEALRAGSPVLELGCGTGRILFPIARAGVEAVGLDASAPMLDIARRKVADLPEETRGRIRLCEGDMRTFELEQKFKLVLIPYRAFLHLMTVEDQMQSLSCIHRHLEAGGRLVFNVFDPRLETIAAHSGPFGSALKKLLETIHPETGNRIIVWDTRRYDCERQIISEERLIEEVDAGGDILSRRYSTLTLRFVYRYEVEHLLARCGFEVENLYGDFSRGPFQYGGEQVWAARKI